jgi:hypothetical protein
MAKLSLFEKRRQRVRTALAPALDRVRVFRCIVRVGTSPEQAAKCRCADRGAPAGRRSSAKAVVRVVAVVAVAAMTVAAAIGGRGPRRDDRGRGRGGDDDGGEELIEKLVHINRVSKTVKGGKRFGFRRAGRGGRWQGPRRLRSWQGARSAEAITKATASAKKKMVRVPLKEGRTLHHDGKGRFGAGKVNVRSAPAGTGIIAGGPMRAVFEAWALPTW